MLEALIAVLRHIFHPAPQWFISPLWLFRSQSRINRDFVNRASISLSDFGDLKRVEINGEIFYWPASSPLNSLLIVAAELSLLHHPHQYLWGPTQLAKGNICLDIGACEGGFAARASALGARVICVEPSKRMAGVMEMLFRERKLEPPIIAPVLLGSAQGEHSFRDDILNPGASRSVKEGAYAVEMLKLDQLVDRLGLERLDFIKCDAEGADADILKSGERVLRRFRPRIAVTTYHGDEDYADLHDYLKR